MTAVGFLLVSACTTKKNVATCSSSFDGSRRGFALLPSLQGRPALMCSRCRSGPDTTNSMLATSAPTLSARMSNCRTMFSSGKKSLARAHMRASKSSEQAHDCTVPDKRHVVVSCATVQAEHELLHPRWFGRFRTALACRHEKRALVTWQSTRALRSLAEPFVGGRHGLWTQPTKLNSFFVITSPAGGF